MVQVDAVKTIPLTRGKFALVDDVDYEQLSRFNWYALKHTAIGRVTYYAARTLSVGGKRYCSYMHREILGVTDTKIQVDHRDGNTLRNQRDNLRAATRKQNQQNRLKSGNKCSSLSKGVSWHRETGKWRACIVTNYKQKHLGLFENEGAAADAYDRAARQQFGEFALTNS